MKKTTMEYKYFDQLTKQEQFQAYRANNGHHVFVAVPLTFEDFKEKSLVNEWLFETDKYYIV